MYATDMKVYCETSFFSYLTGRKTADATIALRQASTMRWWQSETPKCKLFISVHVTRNCRHMANRFALPKTISVVANAGYASPAIFTPDDYMKEDLDER